MKSDPRTRALAFAGAIALLALEAKGDGTVFCNNYDSGYGVFLVQNGVTNPAPAGTMVQVLGGPDADHLFAVTNTPGDDGYTILAGDINALGSGTGSFFDYAFGPVAGVAATSNAVLQVVAWYGTAVGDSALWTQATGSDPAPSGSPPPIPTPTILNLPGPVYIFDSGSDARLLPGLTGIAQTGAGGQGPLGPTGGTGAGCGLWLSVSASAGSNLLLTIHNTLPLQSYAVSNLYDLRLTNWTLVTNVTGACGSDTDILLPLDTRSNAFFRAAGLSACDTNFVFKALAHYSNTVTVVPAVVPDTMGAVSTNRFVELLNSMIAVYDKCGTVITQTYTTNFFAVTNNGTRYPTGGTLDGRILYDVQSNRWIACAIDAGSANVVLAVSTGDDPGDLASGWKRDLVQVRRENLLTDSATLGLDGNGIYLRVLYYGFIPGSQSQATNAGHTMVALKKSEIYNGTYNPRTLSLTNGLDLKLWTIQPAVNFDNVSTNDYAWFVAKGPPEWDGTNYQGGQVYSRCFQWGTNENWVTNWQAVASTGSTYRNYYDLDGTNVLGTNRLVIATNGVFAPDPGTNKAVALYYHGSRLTMAAIRSNFLWTCQTVGINGTSGVYTNDPSGASVDRSAIQWLEFQVDGSAGTLTYTTNGLIYDDQAASNAMYYYVPSLMVNGAGDMVAGFSGSSATNYIGAYYFWRLAAGVVLSPPRLIQAGSIQYGNNQWGDYSATMLDPTDDAAFWTVQTYADGQQTRSLPWATVVGRIRPHP